VSVSIHVVDGVNGRPLTGVRARLQSHAEGTWIERAYAKTDDEGWICQWPGSTLARGIYQLELDLDGYFSGLGIAPFYPAITIRFRIVDPERSNCISMLITPSACVTYRQN
jgi:5-hydroxyisourate hydrolase-like protein (transthyretin family)